MANKKSCHPYRCFKNSRIYQNQCEEDNDNHFKTIPTVASYGTKYQNVHLDYNNMDYTWRYSDGIALDVTVMVLHYMILKYVM